MESSTRLKKDLYEIWDKDILTISATDLDKEFYSFDIYIYSTLHFGFVVKFCMEVVNIYFRFFPLNKDVICFYAGGQFRYQIWIKILAGFMDMLA